LKKIYNKHNLRETISDTLLKFNDFGLYSLNAIELIAATICHESVMGTYHRQIGGGPALGIAQMEPATEKDIWSNFLKYKQKLSLKIFDVFGIISSKPGLLEINDEYSILMCRLHYYRIKEPLPGVDVIKMANYWKTHYNTIKGKGRVEEFVNNYNKYMT